MKRVRVVAALVAALAFVPHALADTPPLDVYTDTVILDGRRVDVDVYRPLTGEVAGVAILAHGFARERSRHRDLARALAASGVSAIVPDLPHMLDHWGNGDALVEVVRSIERGALGIEATPRSRIVLVGTSAGGLASLLAAAQLPGIAGWVGLDPVDRTGSAVRAASKLDAPAIVLLGEPSVCNLFTSGRSIARAAAHLVRAERIDGASHCDFESPTTKFCRVVCGESTARSREIARAHAVAAVADILRLQPPSSVGDTDIAH